MADAVVVVPAVRIRGSVAEFSTTGSLCVLIVYFCKRVNALSIVSFSPAKQNVFRFGIGTERLQVWKLGSIYDWTAISIVECGCVGRHDVITVAKLPAVIDSRVHVAEVLQRHRLRRARIFISSIS